MTTTAEYSLKIFIALIPVFFFFAFYFRNFVFKRDPVAQSRAFFLGMLVSVVVIFVQSALPRTTNHFIRAAIHASLVEEGLRFALLYYMIRRSRGDFTVVEGMFDGILIGLGFSFAENLHYAVNYDGFVILMRCVSSVPLHVFASGVIAYFLSYRYHCNKPEQGGWNTITRRRFSLLVLALFIPWAYHTAFDYFLFRGGSWNYLMPLLLIAGFSYLEYLLSKARMVIARNILDILGVDADDMEIVSCQKEYEKWMTDTQMQLQPPPPLFHPSWTPFNTIAAAILFIFAGSMLTIYYIDPLLLPRIGKQVTLSLLVWLPAAVALILLVSDKLNFQFVRENLLRLPRAHFVHVKGEDTEDDLVILDVLPLGLFLTGHHELQPGDRVIVTIPTDPGAGNDDELKLEGVISWTNTFDKNLPFGALFRYLEPGPGFTRYRFTSGLQKLKRRVLYGFAVGV